MEDIETRQDYRIQIQFRRRGQGAFDSVQIKSEDFDNQEQFLLELLSIAQNVLEEDADYLENQEEDDE